MSLADLKNDKIAFRKFKPVIEDIQGKNCLTNFRGMDLIRDKKRVHGQKMADRD